MSGKKRTTNNKEADKAVDRAHENQDRSRNEMQKSMLLTEVASMRSQEREELLNKAAGLRKEAQRIRNASAQLRKKRA